MDEEENKEISKNNQNETKQNKKRRKKKHRKSNTANPQTQEVKNEETKKESPEEIANKEETKIEINTSESVPKEIIISKNEKQKGETKEEITINESSKESKKEEKNKDEKEDKIDERNIETKVEENTIEINISYNNSEEPKIILKNKGNNNMNKDDKDLYPLKEIEPMNLISVDEDDGEVDYLKAEQAYELSVLLESHKFIRNIKNFDKKFINLIRIKIVRYERNLYDLSSNDNKFFILYELVVTKNPTLSLIDITILDTIKSILKSYTDVHLVIFISDEELLNNDKNEENNISLIDNLSKEKLTNILAYLNLDSDYEKRIHAFSSYQLKSKNETFQNLKENFKKPINKNRVLKLFNLEAKKEESEQVLEYPCCLAVAANPLVYSKYIPEITSDFKCLLINSIFFMNRYQLCFSASKVLSFQEPAALSLKILPSLKEINDQGKISYDINEDIMIESSDDRNILVNKISQMTNKERGGNINWEICLKYLSFLEEDDEKYKEIIRNYEEGKENDMNEKIVELIMEKFSQLGTEDIKDVDVNKIWVKIE